MGHQSAEIQGLLGYADSEYVAERQHISLFRRESRPQTPSFEVVKEVAETLGAGISGYEARV
ncbi:hypothetical protein BN1723_000552 [Verticillium longisporum]|nr:hypothetical protein BN1723_000552 [Verticillium longisporum]